MPVTYLEFRVSRNPRACAIALAATSSARAYLSSRTAPGPGILRSVVAKVPVYRDSEATVSRHEVLAPVAVQKGGLDHRHVQTDPFRKCGAAQLIHHVVPNSTVRGVDGRERVGLLRSDDAAFDLELQLGVRSGPAHVPVPSDARLRAVRHAFDVVAEALVVGAVEVDVVDLAVRVGLAKDGRVSAHDGLDDLVRTVLHQKLAFVAEGVVYLAQLLVASTCSCDRTCCRTEAARRRSSCDSGRPTRRSVSVWTSSRAGAARAR